VAPFKLLGFTVSSSSATARNLRAEATVKVEVEGEVLHTAANGNGPVNALDAALRKALRAFYPPARRRPSGGLQGAHPRRRCRHRSQDAGRHRLIRRMGHLVDRWLRHEHHRRLLAGALGDSLEYALWKSGAQSPQRRDERHFTTASPGGR
jgi:2-isopropylmalate synthase